MILSFVICFFLIFSSCGKPRHEVSQTARLSLTSDPTMLDPRRARDLDSITLIHMLFEGLTRTAGNGKAELAIANSVEVSEDGLCYIFHLRDSQWSNGDSLTAFDFVTSWKAILDPTFATDIAYQLYPIKNARKLKLGEIESSGVGIEASDAHTLIVELENPVPYFLELVAMPSFFPVPSHITTQNLDWALYPETFISNGPFVLEKWNHADQVTLVKNSRYWESNNVKLSGIDFFIVNPDTALQMFENGKLDWIGSPLSTIPSDAIANLKKQSLLQISPFQATYFYRLNTSPILAGKQNPLSDRNLRCALALAIDREAIVSHVLQGGHTPAINLVPPDMGLSQEHSIDGQGKWENLLLEPITISYSNSERNAAIAQAVQQQWEKKLGIQVSLEALEPKIFFQRVSKREFQIAAGSWTADFNDPVNFLEVFKYKEGSTNNTGWENIDYIDLLNRSALCRDEEERRKLFRDAEKILMEHMPIIPIFHFALNYVKKPQLAGTLLSSMGQLDLRSAYIDGSIAAEGNVR